MASSPVPKRYSIGIGLGLLAALLLAGGMALSLRAQVEGEDIVPDDEQTVSDEGDPPEEDAGAGTVELLLRPHCGEADISPCPSFEAEDPLTLLTPALGTGETLDLDVVIINADRLIVERARTWIVYDPEVLEGVSVQAGDALPVAAPGEEDFDADNGYVMIDVESEDLAGTDAEEITVARVQFTVAAVPEGGRSILAFHDPAGDAPHVAVYTAAEPDISVLALPLGSLAVVVEEQPEPDTSPGSSSSSSSTEEETDSSSSPSAESSVSSTASSRATSSAFPAPSSTSPASSTARSASSSFTAWSEESSSLATSSEETVQASSSPVETQDNPADEAPEPEHPAATRTSFVLTQVQNVRVTTDGTSLYAGWDALPSPELKGYHVYYGTQMGKYIQRRTVRPEQTSLAVRSLARGTTYYVAVRGFDEQNEETAFSQEAAVTIGDPSTSTAPLRTVGGLIGDNPLDGSAARGTGATVPGASGPATTATLLVGASALMGTLFAFRRQTLLSRSIPHA